MRHYLRFRPSRKPADGVGEVPRYDPTPWLRPLMWFAVGWVVGGWTTVLVFNPAGFWG